MLVYSVSHIERQASEEAGHAPNCTLVEVINQSEACIFLQVDLEGIVAREMKRISLRFFRH